VSPFVAFGMRALGRSIVAARIDLRVVGLENVPRRGACMIVARHFHHLYDGAALVAAISRPVHVLVALDWVRGRTGRLGMEALCSLAGWPVVLREDPLEDVDPVSRRKDTTGWLPFHAGFATILERAVCAGTPVSLIPAGFAYEGAKRPRVVLRFGPAIVVAPESSRERLVEVAESAVRALSR
jgi:1-acyl-sn-glycerol-3-phosphate acyltransferase